MSESPTIPTSAARRPIRVPGALLLALSGMLSMGCNAFAPSALGSLAASREEKRVLEQAAVDSFPSPEDVGLGMSDEKP
jgi:hypothetical protein